MIWKVEKHISVIRNKRVTSSPSGWSRKPSQWKWTFFSIWKNGGSLKVKAYMGGGMAPGPSGSTSYWTVGPMCVRTDLMPPEASIQPQPGPSGPNSDSPLLSLFFHQLQDRWVAFPWRCLTLTAALFWQSLFPADTNSMSRSLPALAGLPAPRIHTQPCPSWKCLKKRWGMSLPGCWKV